MTWPLPRRMVPALTVALILLAAAPAVAEACIGGWRPQSLDDQLMCPTCHVPLNQSESQAAQDIRNFVEQRCNAGWSEQRTKQALIDQFGTQILAAPPFRGFDALAWIIPAGLLTIGAAVAGGLAWAWTRRSRSESAQPAATIDNDLASRIDADLSRFDQRCRRTTRRSEELVDRTPQRR